MRENRDYTLRSWFSSSTHPTPCLWGNWGKQEERATGVWPVGSQTQRRGQCQQLASEGRRWEPFYTVFLSRSVHHSATGDMRKESTDQNLIRIRNDPGWGLCCWPPGVPPQEKQYFSSKWIGTGMLFPGPGVWNCENTWFCAAPEHFYEVFGICQHSMARLFPLVSSSNPQNTKR